MQPNPHDLAEPSFLMGRVPRACGYKKKNIDFKIIIIKIGDASPTSKNASMAMKWQNMLHLGYYDDVMEE